MDLIKRHLKSAAIRIGLVCFMLGLSVNLNYGQDAIEQRTAKIIDTFKKADGTKYTKETVRDDIFSQEEIDDLLQEVPEDESFVSRQIEVTKRYEDGSIVKQKHIKTAPGKKAPGIFEGPDNNYGDAYSDDRPIRKFLKQFSDELKEIDFGIPDINSSFREGADAIFEGAFPAFEGSTYLGVQTKPNAGEGVLIKSVVPDSPADKIGLEAEDVIVSIDDEPVNSPSELRKVLSTKKGGEEVKINFLRGGVPLVLFVEVASKKSAFHNFFNIKEGSSNEIEPGIEEDGMGENQQWPWKKGDRKKNLLGISVQELSNYNGLKVVSVEPNSPAAIAGIAVDDVIVKFDKIKVENPAHLKSLLEDKSGETVRIDLRRDNKKKKVMVKLGSKNE